MNNINLEGDRSCPVILTAQLTDKRYKPLAMLAWRSRLHSGELPLIVINQGDDPGNTELDEWVRVTATSNSTNALVIELYTLPALEFALVTVVGAPSRYGSTETVMATFGEVAQAHSVMAKPLGPKVPQAEEFTSLHTAGLVEGIRVGVPESTLVPNLDSAVGPVSNPKLDAVVELVADLIRYGSRKPTTVSLINDFEHLLDAMNVTDRGSLSREINRRLGMPPGLGVEFYYAPEDDSSWIGLGGQGNGHSFPTTIASVLDEARNAYDDYAGDFYLELYSGYDAG